MAVKIRLARHGAKKRPYYRVVVADSRAPRDGRIIEEVGRYNPMTAPKTINLDLEKIADWQSKGAQLTDAVVRLIPGALGDEMSNVDESFSTAEDGGLLEYAQYTRPAEFNGEGVPPVLVSGDHAKVDAWRRKNAIERTCRWRPDLIETARLTPEERAYAQEILDASYSQSEE